LQNTLGEYAQGEPVFECFNTGAAKARDSSEGYGNESKGGSVRGRVGWWVMVGVVGMVVVVVV